MIRVSETCIMGNMHRRGSLVMGKFVAKSVQFTGFQYFKSDKSCMHIYRFKYLNRRICVCCFKFASILLCVCFCKFVSDSQK